MGEQSRSPVEGELCWVGAAECDRLIRENLPAAERASLFADCCRLNVLYMIADAGSGHIGSSFSSLDMVSWLHLGFLEEGDIYFSSKGHDVPGLYAAMIGLGRLPEDLLHRFRRLEGLPGHPDVSTPGIQANTGSLGMGISKAKGMVAAARLKGKRSSRVVVMLGDGELQEGQFWESLISAANDDLHEITAIVDHNKLQSDTLVSQTSDLGDLLAKFQAFGWCATRVDGHDIESFRTRLAELDSEAQPKIILADTIKGRGVPFMEPRADAEPDALYAYHSGAPSAADYLAATKHLIDDIQARLGAHGIDPLALQYKHRAGAKPIAGRAAAPATEKPERLVGAYSHALLALAERHPDLVALDADLLLDLGLVPFKQRFPDRLVECGIAEQDMVSQASGMALKGLLPICHSFACFLAPRANEQIYNAASERTKIIYVGALAGLVPGGPGHSHQSVRDLSALGAVPGLRLVEPCSEAEMAALLANAVEESHESTYIRLTSIPVTPCCLPADYRPEEGKGVTLRDGSDFTVIGYGPVMLGEASSALTDLETDGLHGRLINLPWLNRVDPGWLAQIAESTPLILTLDNHYRHGGQGQMIGAALAELGLARPPRLVTIGLEELPACGRNDEVLAAHRLDAANLAARFKEAIGI